MPTERFSKKTLAEYVNTRILALEARHGFDRGNGSIQAQGKGDELNRLYGEYSHLRDLAQKFDLPLTRQSPLSLIGSRVRA